MPNGKPAGVPCIHLTADRRCALFGRPERPSFCVGLQPSVDMCGDGRPWAMQHLYTLEVRTSPDPPLRPLLCRAIDPQVLPGVADMVILVPHHQAWHAAGHHVCELLSQVLPSGSEVEHIGSTAVPGLPAKPILDILVVCPSFEALAPYQPAVEALGGMWRGEYGIAGRRYVSFSDADGRSLVHVHCFEVGHPAIDNHRRFRDTLRSSGAVRTFYAEAKIGLQARYATDRAAYGVAKGAVVERILASHGAEPSAANL